MPKTIYGVSRGEYSDYSVVALFSTKEKAQEYIDALKPKDEDFSDYNPIEEYDLDPETADMIRRGYKVWSVLMLRNGAVERAEERGTESYYVESAPCFPIWRRSEAPAYKGTGVLDAIHAHVWAKSEKAAVKIVNEKRAQMIANGEWA